LARSITIPRLTKSDRSVLNGRATLRARHVPAFRRAAARQTRESPREGFQGHKQLIAERQSNPKSDGVPPPATLCAISNSLPPSTVVSLERRRRHCNGFGSARMLAVVVSPVGGRRPVLSQPPREPCRGVFSSFVGGLIPNNLDVMPNR
jgi:hypothetical protein